MRAIERLSEETINQIAAGEVIENPASVIKELIENSLDAGSKRITVEIQGGGFHLIRICDDGIGMGREDALLSLERHATSKIRKASDLFSLLTMGFRGEALSSIAAISKLVMITSDGVESTKITCEGGKILSLEEVARNHGTTIEISSLFYNTPARKKFQKSSSSSSSDIHKLLIGLALAHPEVALEFMNQNERVFCAPAYPDLPMLEGLSMRVQEVLGSSFMSAPKQVTAKSGNLHLTALLGSPHETRGNRTGQYTFINRRLIVAPSLSFAVKEAYATSLSEGRFPLYVLHLELPPEEVDINVHPQKREVRFHQEEELKRKVRSLLGQSLFAVEEPKGAAPVLPERIFPTAMPLPLPNLLREEPLSAPLISREQAPSLPQPVIPFELPLNPIGLFEHYLFIEASYVDEKREGLAVIDVAASFATLLEEREKKGEKSPSQGLLFPIYVELSQDEVLVLNEKLTEMRELGFSLRQVGKHLFLLEAVPASLEVEEALTSVKAFLSQEEGKLDLTKSKGVRRKRRFTLEEALIITRDILKRGNKEWGLQGEKLITFFNREELAKWFTGRK